MKPTLQFVLGIVALATAAQSAAAQRGRVEVDTVHSVSVTDLFGAPAEARVTVYLPPSYAISPRARYPVVYLLHGWGITDDAWIHGFNGRGPQPGYFGVDQIMDSLIASHVVKEMIIVMPDAATRLGGSYYVNSQSTGRWDDFIARDLVAWTDARFRTLPRPESRGIAGHSMGGYGALYLGMRHGGETYGALYAMSPCCTTLPARFDPARDGPLWDSLAQAGSFEALARMGFLARAQAGLMAAVAPDLSRPPLFVPLLEVRKGGEWKTDSAAAAALAAHSPARMVAEHRAELLRLRAIQLDGGRQDHAVPPGEWMHLDTVLTQAGVPHTFELFDGTHTDHIQDRLMGSVFPFFSRALQFDTLVMH